jgi:hypothetical protein
MFEFGKLIYIQWEGLDALTMAIAWTAAWCWPAILDSAGSLIGSYFLNFSASVVQAEVLRHKASLL